jgi:hypothetical protein
LISGVGNEKRRAAACFDSYRQPFFPLQLMRRALVHEMEIQCTTWASIAIVVINVVNAAGQLLELDITRKPQFTVANCSKIRSYQPPSADA